jgi:lipoate-protein ligase A
MTTAEVDLSTGVEQFSRSVWRLIIDDAPRSGASNMAIDQAMAEACAAGEAPPTLRFYRWQPPAVSLGRLQPIAEIDLAAVEAHGYEVVRRSTGGRAILHVDELTYSVAAAKEEPRVSGGVMDAYLRLSNALLAGLQEIGLSATKAGGDVRAGKDVSAACFEAPSAYEITAGGRKLLGSAQSRRVGYVLQHGSLPLTGDITRLIPLLNLPADQRPALQAQLRNRAQTLEQALTSITGASDVDVQFEHVARALCRGFEEVLNLELRPGTLTPAEVRRSAELIREKYANPEWTHSH